uniref:Uncharacterized protein n=1 Tax=Anopheles atroparvus TaxID=41427 RepID=A0AAG5CXP6_ANOAO
HFVRICSSPLVLSEAFAKWPYTGHERSDGFAGSKRSGAFYPFARTDTPSFSECVGLSSRGVFKRKKRARKETLRTVRSPFLCDVSNGRTREENSIGPLPGRCVLFVQFGEMVIDEEGNQI